MKTLYKKKTPIYTIEETSRGTFKVFNTKTGKGWQVSKREVAISRIFDKDWHPEPFECWKCKKKATFGLGSTPVHEELAIVHYGCVACGYQEDDALD